MRRVALFTTSLVIACGAFTSPLAAQANGVRMPCHNAAEIAKQLSSKYEEAPVAFGLQSNGNLLQVYASTQKDTWTVVSTTPNGMSCIVAAGKKWESLPLRQQRPDGVGDRDLRSAGRGIGGCAQPRVLGAIRLRQARSSLWRCARSARRARLDRHSGHLWPLVEDGPLAPADGGRRIMRSRRRAEP
jgi:hypothetical protein